MRNSKILLTTIILMLLCIIPALSGSQQQISSELDMEECIQLALSIDPLLKAKTEAIYAARANISDAESQLYYPSFDLEGEATYGDVFPHQTFRASPWNLGVSGTISYPIYIGGIHSAQINIANSNLEIALVDQHKTTQDVIYNAMTAFLQVLISQKVYEVKRLSYQLNSEMEQDALSNYENGLLNAFDYNRTAIALELAAPEVLAAEQQLILSKNNLFIKIGYPLISQQDTMTNNIIIEGEFDTQPYEYTMEESIELAMQNNPDIKMMERNIEILDQSETIIAAGELPVVSGYASGGVSWSQQNSINMAAAATGGSMIGLEDHLSPQYNIVVGLQIQYDLAQLIFPNDSISSQEQSLQYQRTAMQHQLQSLKDGIRIAVISGYLSIQQASQNFTTRERALSLAEENMQLAQRRYEMGILDYLNYKDVEVNFLNAQLLFYSEQYNYNEAKLSVAKLIGTIDQR